MWKYSTHPIVRYNKEEPVGAGWVCKSTFSFPFLIKIFQSLGNVSKFSWPLQSKAYLSYLSFFSSILYIRSIFTNRNGRTLALKSGVGDAYWLRNVSRKTPLTAPSVATKTTVTQVPSSGRPSCWFYWLSWFQHERKCAIFVQCRVFWLWYYNEIKQRDFLNFSW